MGAIFLSEANLPRLPTSTDVNEQSDEGNTLNFWRAVEQTSLHVFPMCGVAASPRMGGHFNRPGVEGSNRGSRVFNLRGGGGASIEPPKTGGGGLRERSSIDRTIDQLL